MTQPGRVLSAKGHKPVGLKEMTRETFSLYGTVEPDAGKSFVQEYPKMSSENFQQFLTAFGEAHRVGLHVIVLDGASIHWAVETAGFASGNERRCLERASQMDE